MSFLDKLSVITSSVVKASGEAAKTVAHEAKLYSKLAEHKSDRDRAFVDLGHATFDGRMDEIDTIVEKINFLNEEIEELESQLLKKSPTSTDEAVEAEVVDQEAVEEVSEEEIPTEVILDGSLENEE